MRNAIGCLVLVLAASDAGAQTTLYPGRLIPMLGQIPGGGFIETTRGILVDVDADGDADVMGLSTAAPVFIVVKASGGTFPPGAAYTAGYGPEALCAADVDGDGDQDGIVVCNLTPGGPQLWTYLNDGSGGFGATPLVHPLPGSLYITAISVLRLNNDAIPDLALDGGGTWGLLVGAGAGSYGPLLPHVQNPPCAFADSDGDGDDDFHFVTNGSLTVVHNGGAGIFSGTPVVLATFNPALTQPAFADVTGDGLLDAVVYGPIPNGPGWQTGLQVAPGNGTGVLAAGALQLVSGSKGATRGPILADLDGDGDRDLIAWEPNASLPDEFVLVSLTGPSASFAPASTFELKSGFLWGSVVPGDVDADGDLDVAAFVNGSVVLFPNDGTGNLGGPGQAAIGGTSSNVVRIADLNRDGRPDAVSVLGSALSTAISVVLDLGAPSPPQVIPYGASIQDLALGDMNRDGVLDLVAAVGTPFSGIAVFIGNGSGGFGPSLLVATSFIPNRIELADTNGDLRLDVVAIGAAQLWVLAGDGLGSLFAPVLSPQCPGCLTNSLLAVGDVNSDGFIDAVVGHPGFLTPPTTTIHLGTGVGTFVTFLGNPNPILNDFTTILEDVDGDAILDAVQASNGPQAMLVRIGMGNGGFGPPTAYSATGPGGLGYGGDLALGDVNGDGTPDAVFSGGMVLLNPGGGEFVTPAFYGTADGTRVALADVDLDLQTDVIRLQPARGRLAVLQNLTASTGLGFAFGIGCPGTGGFVPRLSAFGLPQPGGVVTLRVDRGGVLTQAWFFVSPNPALIPLVAGCTLCVDPASLTLLPLILVGPNGPNYPGTGHADVTITLPPAPGLFTAAVQVVISDVVAPLGYSGSNGLFFAVQ